MERSTKAFIIGLALVAAFAAGRFTASKKVTDTTQTSENAAKHDKEDTDTRVNKHKKTTTTEVTNPDGSKTTTTVTEEDSQADKKSHQDNTDTDTKKVAEKRVTIIGDTPTTVSAMAGVQVTNPDGIDWGLSVTKPILGPLTVGVFGFTSGKVGASVGLSF